MNTNATVQRARPLLAHTTKSEQAWQRQYEALIAYRRQHPDDWPQVRQEFPEGNRLGVWCTRQRMQRNNRVLPQERQVLLEQISFPWDGLYLWQRQYITLVRYREHHPDRWPTTHEEWPAGNALGEWCRTQRSERSRRQLAAKRMDMLNAIGFPWHCRMNTTDAHYIKEPARRLSVHRERSTASRGWLGDIIGMVGLAMQRVLHGR